GDAAILVDAHEPEELAQALAVVLTDRAINEGLREQGPKWAARFTWEETARQTLAVYRRCSS
ncbi:MAG: glycosyltransferase family 1 protein, partial [Chloroflexi bacterium]|nr:glycosyltransferase family 1 protein [Chloroflexota bacterium]